jgi:hypothetical protein
MDFILFSLVHSTLCTCTREEGIERNVQVQEKGEVILVQFGCKISLQVYNF